MRIIALVALTLAFCGLAGCRYAEYPTPNGPARYLNIGFATKADKIRLADPSGARLEVDGAESDSAKAIDALAALAKAAAVK